MTEPAHNRYGAARTSLRTAVVMVIFATIFTFLMSATHRLTEEPIRKAQEAERMHLIGAILPSELYDNNVLVDAIRVSAHPGLDARTSTEVLRARKAGQDTALILESTAQDGYSGKIRLLLALTPEGRILGVRVLEHRETPGLGDYIDPSKDRQKSALWIDQFVGLSFALLAPEKWQVRKDGGDLTYRTGATISARAVIGATRRAMAFAQDHHLALFQTPSGELFTPPPATEH
jgi:Na+-translocating ferredoxin:NAD+ oxidoreductase subunit G